MIEIVRGDLLDQKVDAIVNPANEMMTHAGGLAQTIAIAAGPQVIRESRSFIPVPTGGAVFTSAGRLRYKGIIHAVGPVWMGGRYHEDELLANAYRNAIRVASENQIFTLAIPAISTGIFRFPIARASKVAVRTLRFAEANYPQVALLRICVTSDEHWDAFSNALVEERPGGIGDRLRKVLRVRP